MSSQDSPRHIAIIMDGNGRWAKAKNLGRSEGHRAGAKSVQKIVTECRKLGVRYLTLYSFSTENWNRETSEVEDLMKLLKTYLDSELPTLLDNNIRLRAIGNLDRLPFAVRSALRRNIDRTQHNTGMDLVLALSYGAREEILQATKQIAQKVSNASMSIDDINEELFSSYLWTEGVPDPDVLIRTSGEMRISNFLLWQLAYTEIIVRSEFWPDFNEETLHLCIKEYNSRERRFGLTSEQIKVRKEGGA